MYYLSIFSMDMTFNPIHDAFLLDAKILLSRANTLIGELEEFMDEFQFTDESMRRVRAVLRQLDMQHFAQHSNTNVHVAHECVDPKTTELELKNRCASLHTECTAWFKNAKENCALLTKRENELIAKMDKKLSKYVQHGESLNAFLNNTYWFTGKLLVMIEASEPWTREVYLFDM